MKLANAFRNSFQSPSFASSADQRLRKPRRFTRPSFANGPLHTLCSGNQHMLPQRILMLALLFGAAPAVGTFARAEEPAAKPEVEVLARGPVHEAYAEPVGDQPGPGPVVTTQPPA